MGSHPRRRSFVWMITASQEFTNLVLHREVWLFCCRAEESREYSKYFKSSILLLYSHVRIHFTEQHIIFLLFDLLHEKNRAGSGLKVQAKLTAALNLLESNIYLTLAPTFNLCPTSASELGDWLHKRILLLLPQKEICKRFFFFWNTLKKNRNNPSTHMLPLTTLPCG